MSGLSRYGEILDFLLAEPGFVATTVLYAVLAGLCLAVSGTWLPLLAWRTSHSSRELRGDSPAAEPDLNGVALLALAVGGGLVLTVSLGTASAYLLKRLLPGLVAAVVVGLLTLVPLVRGLRGGGIRLGTSRTAFAVLTVIAFSLGLWQHVIMAFPRAEMTSPHDSSTMSVIAFADLHRDSGFHVHLATILSQTGLPLRDLYGSPTQEYSPVIHTGHGVLLGSLAGGLGTSEYRASTALWIVVMVLTAWSACALLAGEDVPGPIVVLGSLCPLVLGPLSVPTLAMLTQPQFVMGQLIESPLTAARMYWNLPQATSTAMVAVALICVDGLCRAAGGRGGRLWWTIAAAAAIGASGWVKPSLFVFYAPALVLALVVHRAGIRETAAAVVIFVAAAAVYLLPSWLVSVAEHPSWSLHPTAAQTQHVVKFLLLGCGPALLLSLGPLRRMFGSILQPSQPQTLTVALVAMGGSLLFALLFREDRYAELENFAVFQPNIWWGPSACVVLLVPLLLRSAVQRIRAAGRADWFVVAGVILGAVQVVGGTLFAVAYPAVNGRIYPQKDVDVLLTARARTTPTTRFLIDPILLHPDVGFSDVAGMLGRPCLFGTSYMSDAEQEILISWNELFFEPHRTEGTGWAGYDAAILSDLDGAGAARTALAERGWTSEDLGEGFSLWRRPVDPPETGGGAAPHSSPGQ